MKITLTILFTLFSFINSVAANQKRKSISIPFEVVGSYVVVKLSINYSTPLNLILDSGVRNTIITELTPEDSISINYSEPTTLKGLGNGEELKALSSHSNSIQMGKLNLTKQTILVLEKDIFNLSKYTGMKINGLLGSDIFQNNVVEVNYSRKRIVFHDPETFKPSSKYKSCYLSVEGQKMFIQIPITETNGTTREVKMLVDTGAELTAWFRSHGKNPLSIPEKRVRCFIGQGLNGEISGVIGRIPAMYISDFKLTEPIVAFPDSSSISDLTSEGERDGTLGSQILNRFNLIFDLRNNLLYIKPNYFNFNRKFSYNISGIEIIQQNNFLRLPEVIMVWKDSPAEKAGVKPDDQILEINGKKSFEMDINQIRNILQTQARKLHLRILRGDQEILLKFGMKSGV